MNRRTTAQQRIAVASRSTRAARSRRHQRLERSAVPWAVPAGKRSADKQQTPGADDPNVVKTPEQLMHELQQMQQQQQQYRIN